MDPEPGGKRSSTGYSYGTCSRVCLSRCVPERKQGVPLPRGPQPLSSVEPRFCPAEACYGAEFHSLAGEAWV